MASAPVEPEVIILSDSDDDIINVTHIPSKNGIGVELLKSRPLISEQAQSNRGGVQLNQPLNSTSLSSDWSKNPPIFLPLIGGGNINEDQRPNLVRKDPVIKSAQEYLTVAQKLQNEMGIFSLKDGVKCSAIVGVNGVAVEEKRRSRLSKSLNSAQNAVAMWTGPPERLLSKKTICPATSSSDVNEEVWDKTKTRLDAIIHDCSEKVRMRSEVSAKDGEASAVVDLFQLCRKHAKDKTDIEILDKMWARVVKCDSTYTKSRLFQDFTGGVHKKVAGDPQNMHIFLKEFFDELKSSSKVKKNISKVQQSAPSRSALDLPDSRSKQKSSSSVHSSDATLPLNGTAKTAKNPSSSRFSDDEDQQSSANNGTLHTADSVQERRIKKLEKMLAKCSKRIRKYEEAEMTLDDLEDEESTYLLIDRYKKRSMQIWNKLCEVTGRSSKTGRVQEQKFVYEGTRYPEVNKQISRLINKSKVFPDYNDICNTVKAANDGYELHLLRTEIENLACDIFSDVGKELKRRRIMDYEEHFGCHIGDTNLVDSDPAKNDEQLKSALKENRQLATKRCDDVFDAFLEKQQLLESQGLLPAENEDQAPESDDEKSVDGGESSSNKDEDSASDAAVIDLGDSDSDESTSDLENKQNVEPEEESRDNDEDDISVGGRQREEEKHVDCVKETSLSQSTAKCPLADSVAPQTNPRNFQEALDSSLTVPVKPVLVIKRKILPQVDSQPTNSKRLALDDSKSDVGQPSESGFSVKRFNGCEHYTAHRQQNTADEQNHDEEIVIIN